jgi:hypothetical protein
MRQTSAYIVHLPERLDSGISLHGFAPPRQNLLQPVLQQHPRGIICSSSGQSNHIPQDFLAGRFYQRKVRGRIPLPRLAMSYRTGASPVNSAAGTGTPSSSRTEASSSSAPIVEPGALATSASMLLSTGNLAQHEKTHPRGPTPLQRWLLQTPNEEPWAHRQSLNADLDG